MNSKHSTHENLAHNEEVSRELAQLGISCIPIDNFYYREFHYTNLEDAIAQATRDQIRIGLHPA